MADYWAEYDRLRAAVEQVADTLRDDREVLQPGSMGRVGLDVAETRLRHLLAAFPPGQAEAQ